MSDIETKVTATGPRVSIFIKCLAILVVSTAAVAGTLSVMSNSAARSVAEHALKSTSESVTTLGAQALAGAVRFNKPDDAQQRIELLISHSDGEALGAVVVRAEGEVLAVTGQTSSDLENLARTAMETGAPAGLEGTYWTAVPIGTTDGKAATGALAVVWTPDVLYAEIATNRITSLLWTAALFLATLLISGVFLRQSISRPISALAKRTTAMADGDYESAIPSLRRKDEIGDTARQLNLLRDRLASAQAATREAVFQGAGFQASSAAMLMTDLNLVVTHHNSAFHDFASANADALKDRFPGFSPDDLTGLEVNVMHADPNRVRKILDNATFPHAVSIAIGERAVSLIINRVSDPEGNEAGYILEWSDITETRKNTAVLAALEAAQVRADFGPDGSLHAANDNFAKLFGSTFTLRASFLKDMLKPTSVSDALDQVTGGKTVFDKFEIGRGDDKRIVQGSLSPILDQGGRTTGSVLLGTDITENEAIHARSAAETAVRDAAQKHVVTSLGGALDALSRGDLTTRIDDPFAADYEELRAQFNTSLAELDQAVGTVVDNATAILGETGNISGAADDLSGRTERQAATLEEFAAALTELTASVASSAEGATQASSVVIEARKNAEASGSVVREAIEAMGEISTSSDQISRIIGVIDDIAFQTNLLALNAGVEAARAGDAGRGFAVVASEVRALAQRSSDAAREINTLISTSGNHVKRGVSLVDKAGEALQEIVSSVSGIADHVTSIAASAREQATGLDEINVAINELDQVTQENVAMFEETTAATHTLTAEANALVDATRRFKASSAATTPQIAAETGASGPHKKGQADASAFASARAQAAPKVRRNGVQPVQSTRTGVSAPVSGNLALDVDEDDWEDF